MGYQVIGRMRRLRCGAVAAAATLLGTAPLDAATVEDYFDYGSSDAPLNGLGGAGDGWSTAWTPTAPAPNDEAGGYFAGERLTFNNGNYDNSGNLDGAANGVAGFNAIANAGSAQHRSFHAMTGDVWISALVAFENPDDGHVLLWLNRDANAQNFVSYRKGDFHVRYGNTNTVTPLTLATDTTYLYLVKLGVDAAGNESLSFWIKGEGDDIASEAALGAALFAANSSDIMAGLSNVGFSFETNDGEPRNGSVDALRISNDANAFQMVTAVPEPASLGLLGFGGVLAMGRRRGR